jgi:predicted Zn-dependent protease
LEIDEYLMLQYDIAFPKNDKAAMDHVAGRARERSGGEAWIANKQANTLAYSGQLRQAKILFQRSVDQDMQQALPERAALWDAGESLWEAWFGNVTDAKTRVTAALKLSNNTEVEYGAALALAVVGDSRAEALTEDLDRRFPENSVVRFSYLPVLRARIALNRGEAMKAIEALQAAVPYELGPSHELIGALYPIYMRGEAYLAAGRGTEASGEFQKILNHREIVGSDPIGALAHLQLGRAYAFVGDRAKAKAAYEEFFKLWIDADPEIPVLRQARAEYRNLN